MQLEHTFVVPADIEKAWAVLIDIERVAPCMPGAALESVDGDNFTGAVKVKLGPIGLTYKGKASFIEKDPATHRAVIDAHGKDARGNGTAAAKVTAVLTADGDSTKVNVVTDLNITGKPAQFGRGVMVDVGNKLIGQFADCLAAKLGGADDEAATVPAAAEPAFASVLASASSTAWASSAGSPPSAVSAPAAAPEQVSAHAQAQDGSVRTAAEPSPVREVPRPLPRSAEEVEPIDLLGSAGPAVAKRLVPLLLPIVLLLIVLGRRRRSR